MMINLIKNMATNFIDLSITFGEKLYVKKLASIKDDVKKIFGYGDSKK